MSIHYIYDVYYICAQVSQCLIMLHCLQELEPIKSFAVADVSRVAPNKE